jgi:hypothetical protein
MIKLYNARRIFLDKSNRPTFSIITISLVQAYTHQELFVGRGGGLSPKIVGARSA